VNGRPPKIVFAVGAPDGMSRAAATDAFNTSGLHGVSGIATVLLPWLNERGHPFATVMFGSSGTLDADAVRRVAEQARGEVLVNLICDAEIQRRALQQVERFGLETQLPLVNPPWAVAATTRPLIARRLAHQAKVRAPMCTSWPGGAQPLAAHIEAHGHTYPVLLRPPGRHGSDGLVRADDPDEVAAHAAKLPACSVTDFVDFRSGDGLWRKYRMVCAGDRLFRRHMLADEHWNLTAHARDFMQEHPQLVAEEQKWLAKPVTLRNGSVEQRVMHQFRALQLDFGAVDYALRPNGELVVFEINACVQLTNYVDEEAASVWAHIQAGNEEILHTLLADVVARAAPG
jgi:biotin carboxylase